jgi:hypothetical protein
VPAYAIFSPDKFRQVRFAHVDDEMEVNVGQGLIVSRAGQSTIHVHPLLPSTMPRWHNDCAIGAPAYDGEISWTQRMSLKVGLLKQ